MRTPSFILANASALIERRVSGISGMCRLMKSPSGRASSIVSTRSTPSSLKRSLPTNGSYATTFMPRPSAARATYWPIRPKPSTASVLSATSTPPHFERSQRPSLRAAWACGTLRASASSSATACSAAETTVDSGAFATTMPWRVAAGTSTLSTPTPARPITFRLVACSISSAVSFVAERMTMPS